MTKGRKPYCSFKIYFPFIVYYNSPLCPFDRVPEYCRLIAWETCIRHHTSCDSCGARGRHKRDTCNLSSAGIMSGLPKCNHVVQRVRIASRCNMLHTYKPYSPTRLGGDGGWRSQAECLVVVTGDSSWQVKVVCDIAGHK
jgi:hypothetical protein